MQGFASRRSLAWLSLAASLVMAGCATKHGPAPVEDRSASSWSQSQAQPPGPVLGPDGLPTTYPDGRPLPGIENKGKPGYYTVQSGDTVRRIAASNSRDWREIVSWNNLDDPNKIEVGQVLRVAPPAGRGAAAVVAAAPAPVVPTPVAPVPAPAVPEDKPVPAEPPLAAEDNLGWIWPAQGPVLARFDDAKNKGLDIGGKAGDPVVAAADGKVVYAGAGLRGYGNLIILKHNNTFLTAYAHNQTLLVKEDQSVKKGQKIAEMGSTDSDRVKLHFEIRRQGKPVDPSRYLPAR
jgi:lipoprotein NlpD